MREICTLLMSLGLFAFVQGELTGTIQKPINFYKKTVNAGSQNYEKNVLNDSIPLEITFTWTPTGSTILNASDPITWTRNENVTLTVPRDTATGDLYYKQEAAAAKQAFTLYAVKNLMEYTGKITLILNLANGSKERATVTVETAPLITADEKPRRHLQADVIQIRCPVQGNPAPSRVEWSRFPVNNSDSTIQFSSRISASTSPGSQTINDTLHINSLEFTDDGFIRCFVENSLGNDTHVVELRVKDRLAALWPFIGIVIEVLILVTAILLYEKRRSRNLLASREETKEGVNGGYGQVSTSPGEGDADAETRQRAVKA
jgi:hypothetical protein